MEEISLFQTEWIQKYRTTVTQLSDCIERQDFSWQSEKGCLYLCRLWPGVSVWKNEVKMHSLPSETMTEYPFLKMNYCTCGRCEALLENGRYVYLAEGDLSVDRNAPKESFQYPSGKYEGLEIVFNLEILRKYPVTALTDLGIERIWQERMAGTENGSFLANVSPEWDALARELMKRLKEADGEVEDFRFLTIQLLYMLNGEKTFTRRRNVYVTKGQRMIAENIKERLCRDFRQSLTVEELAEEYGISSSSLKKYFRLVYGSPVSEYVKNAKMEYACRMLRETRMSVGEVAAETGYANQGKFGSAFKKIIGETPLEYRRKNIEEGRNK